MQIGALSAIHPRSLRYLSGSLQGLLRGRLWLQVLVGMGLGIVVGVVLGPGGAVVQPETAQTITNWLALPGEIFLASLQMIVIPLVFASIIRGLAASESPEQLKRIGLSASLYFVMTTCIAITIGLAVALLVKPGQFFDLATAQQALTEAGAAGAGAQGGLGFSSVPDAIAGLIPRNPLGAMVEAEMLGVVIFAVVVGIALVSMAPNQSLPLLELLGSLQEVSLTIVRWAMLLAPLAVFGLIARLASQLGPSALVGMGVYVGTVIGALLLLVGAYMLILVLAAKRGPLGFLAAAREVQLLAFSTSSSAAVMPITIKTAEDKLGVRPSIAQVVIPFGATVNMDGTALYQGVATVFLAQAYGLELTILQLGLVIVTAVAASIGSPATPGVGIVILSMVLQSAGVPVEGIALILGVDRILDMSRTAVNVTGDLVAVLVLDRFVTGPSTAEEQRASEVEFEERRSLEHIDVVISGSPPPG